MTFALPGVEEREAGSDGGCEQLSHLLQAMGYVAGLSKLTMCNLSLPFSHPRTASLTPPFSVVTLPTSPFLHAPLLSTFFFLAH